MRRRPTSSHRFSTGFDEALEGPKRPDAPRATPRASWVDLAGFCGGLAVVGVFGWNATDLVWSLWLSSLVVGLASIWWSILSARTDHFAAPAVAAGKVVGLAFFTVHFGGFHFVHSQFLAMFFPLAGHNGIHGSFGPFSGYGQVFANYWIWILPALIAERSRFAARAEGIAGLQPMGIGVYANVVRMHLLIFFFAAVHTVGIDNFFVYAVVYAAYFWPRKAAQ
jgi:Family of unknown function (DUF6498)